MNRNSHDILLELIGMVENIDLRKLLLDALITYNKEILNKLEGTLYE